MSQIELNVDSREPVVFRGGASAWPAAKWTFQSLADRAGDAVVPVTSTKYKTVNGAVTRDGKTRSVSVREFMSELAGGGGDGHLNGSDLLNVMPALRDEIAFPDVGSFCFDTVWVGPTGNTTPIHFDRMPNIFAQIHGEKRWRLWSPAHKLAPAAWRGPGYVFAKVDAGKGPEAAGPPDIDVTLAPGDMITVPTGWWHHVVTVSSSISVNRWWALPKLGKAISRVLPARNVRKVFEAVRDVQMRVIAG